ncbi:MAG: DUF6152 family protein [Pseudomonadota bacterium]
MKKLLIAVAASVMFAGSANTQAHHSFAAEFDAEKTIQLEGIVTKVEWTNPHVWIYMNVKDPATNQMKNWGIELGPPHLLQRRGWRRESLALGTKINADGFMARNGSDRINARTVTIAGTGGAPGETLDAGSSQLERNNTDN